MCIHLSFLLKWPDPLVGQSTGCAKRLKRREKGVLHMTRNALHHMCEIQKCFMWAVSEKARRMCKNAFGDSRKE